MRRELLEALPLLRESVVEDRRAVEKAFIASALKFAPRHEAVTPEGMGKIVASTFPALDFPPEIVNLHITELVAEGVLAPASQGRFTVRDVSRYEAARTPIETASETFLAYIRPRRDDFSWSKDENWRRAFREILFEVVSQFANSLGIQGSEKFSFDHGAQNRARLVRIARDAGVHDSDSFVSLVLDFIKKSAEQREATVGRVLQAALQYDMLSRAARMNEVVKRVSGEAWLLLDTNILVGLMCPTDLAHDLCKTAVSLSKAAGYKLAYLAKTGEEYEAAINTWLDPYTNTYTAPHLRDVANNPIARHWHSLERSQTWVEFETHYRSYVSHLRMTHGIELWTGAEFDPYAEFVDAFNEQYKLARRSSPIAHRWRSDEAFYHDAYFLYNLSELSRHANPEQEFAPIGLSFDTGLYIASTTLNKRIFEYRPSLRKLTDWIRRTSALLGPKVNPNLQRELLTALIENAYNVARPVMTHEYYIEALSVRGSLTQASEKRLKEALVHSEIFDPFERAIRAKRYEDADAMYIAWMTSPEMQHYFDQSHELKRTQGLLREAAKKQHEEVEKRRAVEAKAELLERLVQNSRTTNIVIIGASPETQVILQSILNNMLLANPEWTQANLPPMGSVKKETLMEKLTSLKEKLETNVGLVENGQKLLEYVQSGLSFLRMIGQA